MRMMKPIGVLAAVAFAILGAYAAVSASAINTNPRVQASAISADERAARQQIAQQSLTSIQLQSVFAARLPSSLPAGYTYDRVMWNSARPEEGFAIWLAGPDAASYPVQILEAPYMPEAFKNTLSLPGLTTMTRPSGTWHMLQKADEPGKGMWILVTVQDGVQIEVDGPQIAATSIVDQI